MPGIIDKLHALYLSDNKALARGIKNVTGITPVKLRLYKQALSHSSISKAISENNERLEFLGDSVINLIIGDYLFNKFPKKTEGELTELRSKIVSRTSLNSIALKIGVDKLLVYKKETHVGSSIMGNALEALVGAIYIECGFDDTKKFVLKKIVTPLLDIYAVDKQEYNYKSRVLEWAQKHQHQVKFILLSEKRNKRDTEFNMGIELNGEIIASSTARSKKEAEKKASEKLFNNFISNNS